GRALRVYAGLEVAVACCALLLPPALRSLQPVLAWAYANGNAGLLFDSTRLFVSLLLIAVPATAMGASYPIGIKSLQTGDQGSGIGDQGLTAASRDLRGPGLLYAVNTIGAAVGAAVTGFVLLPAFGLFGTTRIGVALNAATSLGAIALARAGRAEALLAPRT